MNRKEQDNRPTIQLPLQCYVFVPEKAPKKHKPMSNHKTPLILRARPVFEDDNLTGAKLKKRKVLEACLLLWYQTHNCDCRESREIVTPELQVQCRIMHKACCLILPQYRHTAASVTRRHPLPQHRRRPSSSTFSCSSSSVPSPQSHCPARYLQPPAPSSALRPCP